MDANAINSLILMGKGMLAIFVVILVIYLSVLDFAPSDQSGIQLTCISTNRLLLRELTLDDRPALCRILQDPIAMTAYEHAFSDEEVDVWLVLPA